MNYQRTRYVGGPKAETLNTAQRADALRERLAQLAQQRTEDRENLAWDRVGGES